jgi:hypothetical protein
MMEGQKALVAVEMIKPGVPEAPGRVHRAVLPKAGGKNLLVNEAKPTEGRRGIQTGKILGLPVVRKAKGRKDLKSHL